MKENEPDYIPEGIDLSGLTVDDILKEYHASAGDLPAPPEDTPEPAAAPTPETVPEFVPVEAGPAPEQKEPAPETAEPSEPVEEAASTEPETRPSEEEDREPEKPETDIPEPDSPEPDTEKAREDARSPEPDAPEKSKKHREKQKRERREKESAPLKRPSVLSGEVMLAGLAALVAAVLLGVAVAPDLPDPVWSVLVISSLVSVCLPLLVWTVLHFKDRTRHTPPAVMLLAVLLTAAGRELIDAAIAAAVFDVLYAVFARLYRQEEERVMERLNARMDGLDPSRDRRLMACVTELEDRKLKALTALEGVEHFILLGALAATVLFTLVPGLIDGRNFAKWLARASVTVAACAYGGEFAALLSYLRAVDDAFTNGIWIAGTGTVSACADVTSVVFNKTGTLTDGKLRITNIDPVRISQEQLISLAALAGAYSEHPLNRLIRRAAGEEPDKSRISRQRVEIGYGSMVQLDDGTLVGIGNIDFVEKLGVKGKIFVSGDSCAFVCVDRVCVGRIDFTDDIRPDALNAAHDLRKAGVDNIAFMTGDNALTSTNVARRLDIAEVYSDCRPADKVERLEYIQNTQVPGDRTAFVTRAGNERELLELANISVTLGVGDDSTAAYPDIILSDGKLTGLARVIGVSKRVRQNIVFAFWVSCVVRLLTALLGLTGVFPIWAAAAVMAGLSLYILRRSDVRPVDRQKKS